MKLRINGEDREVVDNLSLKDLVTQLNLTPERIAIELNQNVVRRPDWPQTLLRESDRVEIVHFVGGGDGNQGAESILFVSVRVISWIVLNLAAQAYDPRNHTNEPRNRAEKFLFGRVRV